MKRMLILLMALFSFAGCTAVPTAEAPVTPETVPATAVITPTAAVPALATAEPTPTVTTAEPTPTVTASEAAPVPAGVEAAAAEAILIQEPGPGSRVASPLLVRGLADSTFEQNLVVRLLADDGAELAFTAVTIAADLGQRGPFEATLPFTVSGERQAFIQVYASSPRDGGITHLASVGVILTDGPAQIRPAPADTAERILITQPLLAAEISGGVVQVAGVGVAGFEQSLLVEVLDENGRVLASQPVTVNAPDLGQPGAFSADLAYSVAAAGPGRIVVRDISPAFGGDAHLASVEVTLSP